MQLTKEQEIAIRTIATTLANELNLWLDEGADFWTSYGNDIDINIFKYGSDKLQCTAYPVVGGFIITQEMVSIDLPERSHNE